MLYLCRALWNSFENRLYLDGMHRCSFVFGMRGSWFTFMDQQKRGYSKARKSFLVGLSTQLGVAPPTFVTSSRFNSIQVRLSA